MTYYGVETPTNKIIAGGRPLTQELKVETATNMYAGRLVKKGTNADDIVVNDSATAFVGWLGYEETNPVFRPDTIDTIYVINSQAAVHNGGNFYVVASLASGQSVAKGAKLIPTAAGEVKAATTADASTNIVVAIAEQTVNASGAAADIVVRSLI